METTTCCLEATTNLGNSTDAPLTDSASAVPWSTILLGTILYIVVIVTIFGNVLVLVAVYKEKRLRTTFNYYVVNLAITDVSVAVTAMTLYTTSYVLGHWPFGTVMCGVWIFFDYGLTFVSVFTLLLISIDRFWSVTWYVHYRHHNNKRRCIMSIVAVWLFMLVLWLPPCINDRILHSVPGECKWEPSLNKLFVVIVACVGHHGSCFVMMFCYIRVLIAMRRKTKVSPKVNAHGTVNSRENIAEASSQLYTITRAHSIGKDANSFYTPVFTTPRTTRSGITLSPQIANSDKTTTAKNPGNNTSKVTQSQTQCSCTGHGQRRTTRIQRAFDPNTRRQLRDKSIFITLQYIIIAYIICWVPFHFVFDISCIDPLLVPEVIYSLTFYMTYINSTINPILYACSSPEFRNVFMRILCRR